MSTSTLSRNGAVERRQDQAQEDGENDVNTLEKIDMHIEECRSLCQHRLINRTTQQEYEKMWNGLRVEKNLKFMSENSRFLYETISVAEDYESNFKRTLEEGIQQGWMNSDNRSEWIDRFHDSNVLEWDRKKWLKETFPKYVQNWKEVARDRNDVIDLVKKTGISTKEIPEINDVISDKVFFGLHYTARVHKVGKVKALILAREKQQEKFLSFIEKELDSWAKNGWMHSSKVGPWMRRVMESDNAEAFASKVLYPFKNNWKSARERFDAVGPAFKKRKDLRGFTPIKADKFLLLDYDQRIAYLDEAESRLESDVNEQGPLAALRLDIRHAMDTKNWLEAEELLGIAQGMDPNDKAVRSMGRYLATHRTDKDVDSIREMKKEKVQDREKGLEAGFLLQEHLNQIPENMNIMTLETLEEDEIDKDGKKDGKIKATKRLWQTFYNRKWVRDHGYSTNQSEEENAESDFNKELTAKRIADGHDWKFEHNTIKGETANSAGIRDDCTKPQVIYINSESRKVAAKGIIRNKENAMFGYWTTIVDEDVPYDSLQDAVINHMYHIKKYARIMHENGVSFSMIKGESPRSRSVLPKSPQKTYASNNQIPVKILA